MFPYFVNFVDVAAKTKHKDVQFLCFGMGAEKEMLEQRDVTIFRLTIGQAFPGNRHIVVGWELTIAIVQIVLCEKDMLFYRLHIMLGQATRL